MLPKTTCTAYQNAFEETLNYFFNVDTEWLKDLIRSKEQLLDHPKIAHQKKILMHYSGQKDTKLNIFIVGEGNFGKSTLLNAIVQGDIAKMHFLPSTWCIHRYLFGENKPVVYKGGREMQLSAEEAKTLVAEEERKSKENKAYVSDLTQVDWFYPDYPVLKKFTLVDTPGMAQLRSMLSDHSIEEFYYKADCVLWLLDATKVNSEQSLKQIEQLSRYSKKILGVLNKWDVPKEQARDNILRIARDTFGSYLTGIQPVSALFGLKVNNAANPKYKLSGIDELLGKIDSFFLKNTKRLVSIQAYHTLNQTINESSLILRNEIADCKKNIDLYINNLLYIRDQKIKVHNSLLGKLKELDDDFLRKVELKILNQVSYNTIELKLKQIESDSAAHYRNLAIKATEIRNRRYYETVNYLSEKKYIFTKYNYDGTISLLESENTLTNLNPIEAMQDMKVSTKVEVKVTAKFMESFMGVIQKIPFFGSLLKDRHEKKKKELEKEIMKQITSQCTKNSAFMKADIESRIEQNYLDIECSFENQFKKLFTSTEAIKDMIKEQEDKIKLLDGKYLWASAIARKMKDGERYA